MSTGRARYGRRAYNELLGELLAPTFTVLIEQYCRCVRAAPMNTAVKPIR